MKGDLQKSSSTVSQHFSQVALKLASRHEYSCKDLIGFDGQPLKSKQSREAKSFTSSANVKITFVSQKIVKISFTDLPLLFWTLLCSTGFHVGNELKNQQIFMHFGKAQINLGHRLALS